MTIREVDVAIIGAGTAGLNARRECEKAGLDWVMIESGPYGTTCARVGCMPSKLLIAAADRAHDIETSQAFGMEVKDWRIDGKAVMERVRRERDRFTGFVVRSTEALEESRRIRGHARFLDQNTLVIDGGQKIRAKRIVIATGSSPWIPPEFEGIKDVLLTSDDVFELEDLPRSMAVVGTGVIGLELGQALGRLGVEVEFFNPFDELGPLRDPVVSQKAREVFGEELVLHLKTKVREVKEVEGGVEIRWVNINGVERKKVYEEVLVAAGRRSNVQDLDLAKAGVPLDHKNEPISDARTTQIGDLPIFIAGDASGHRPLLHEASDEGRIAGFNAVRYPDVMARVRKVPLTIAFTDPQIAVIGARFDTLDPETTAVGMVSFDNQGRSRVMGKNKGVARLYGSAGDCLLVGAELFGPRMEHIAHLLAWAVESRVPVTELVNRPFYHPVVEEGIRTALRDLAKNLRVIGLCAPESFGESAGV